ncbi:MAG TPA: hypothetical protein VLB04_10235 [Methanotrichaceae archaeon]|nr:hypothetical protein [Methanotrichaceae archaeon]
MEARAAVRLAAEITVLPAVEARPQRTPLQYQHAGAGIRAPRAVVKPQAVARLAAGITAQPAAVWPTAEIGSKRGYLPLNF